MDKQRKYYAATARAYDEMHLIKADEHERAFRFLFGWLPILGTRTILDVGAGTGRLQRLVQECGIEIDILGVEPIRMMREQGHAAGVPVDKLIDGDATSLPFGDDTFDLVIESGVLHHIKNDGLAVREMCRVAKNAVFLSDDNHLGAGGVASRIVKNVAWSIGLWDFVFWLSSGGKPYRDTDYDGIWYWYTILDSIPELRKKFPKVYILTTNSIATTSLRWSARTLAVLATK